MEMEILGKKTVKAVPELRFREFEERWDIKRLKDLADVKGGKRIPKGYSLQDENNGYPYITVSDMQNGTVSLQNIKFVPQEVVSKISNYKIKTSDLFISVAGTLGIVGKIPKELENANLTENANKLTNLKCEQDYLFHYLQTSKLDKLIENVKTSNAQPKLAIYAIKAFIVNHPSIPEQRKIACFLSSVDKKLEQLSRKKALLETYKKGVMQKLFSQEIEFKPALGGVEGDENEKDFPEWRTTKLKDICSFFSGGTPTSTNKEFYAGNIPFIGSGNIHDSEVFNFITEEALNSSSAKLVEKGDILYALYGANSGEVAISNMSGAINQAILCIRTEANTSYLYYLLHHHQGKIISRYLQGGQGNLSANIIKNLEYKFPHENEQQKIADFLSAIDRKIEAVSQQIEKTKTFKKGLLQQMFV